AVAFELGDASLSYGALIQGARVLGHDLQASGVGRGDVVGVAAEDAALATMALLAIWSIGAVYLPLDPALPRRRLAIVLDDADPSALLVAPGVHDRLPMTRAPRLALNPSSATTEPGSLGRPVEPRPEGAAC